MARPSGTAVLAPRAVSAHFLDYLIPTAILLAVLVVLAPVPAAVVDLLLAANLTVSVLALLGALAARTPMEMSVFPTFLLGSTLVRLVLNIATTRLILSRAAIDGPAAAGHMVEAFGTFVAANNLVVGAVIFAIIAVIQFVVITAGSTRTSEVAARFALDGLPGRQMTIDSEVQAGTITREQARGMRLDLQRQTDFFASMDGASRFVRGEAVASVIITLINLVGGLAIGVLQHSLSLPKALDIYSRLTIGDGLVSAVPSLFVSVAMALLISRSSQRVDLSGELGRQFTSRPHVLAITAAFLGILSLTHLPFMPLAAMAVMTIVTAYFVSRSPRQQEPGDTEETTHSGRNTAHAGAAAALLGREALAEDRIVVELGRGLIGMVAGTNASLVERAGLLRYAVASDMGIVVPEITFRDDLTLAGAGYRITIAGEVVSEAEMPQGRLLAIPAVGERFELEGSEAIDPLTHRRAVWLSHAQAETARRRGATVLDDGQCVARSLEAALRQRADRLLSRDSVARLIESLRASQPALVEQVVPEVLTIAKIHRTLQCLLRESVPVRPLSEVLEVMADHAAETPEPGQLAEYVRRRLARAICRRGRDPQGKLTVLRLTPAILDLITPSGGAGHGAAREAAHAQRLPPASDANLFSAKIIGEVRRALRSLRDRGGIALLVVPGDLRRTVREALIRHIPDIQVYAEEEVADETRLELFATVGSDAVPMAA